MIQSSPFKIENHRTDYAWDQMTTEIRIHYVRQGLISSWNSRFPLKIPYLFVLGLSQAKLFISSLTPNHHIFFRLLAETICFPLLLLFSIWPSNILISHLEQTTLHCSICWNYWNLSYQTEDTHISCHCIIDTCYPATDSLFLWN